MTNVPKTQRAVQLVGPNQLVLNDSKQVYTPGPHQILCRVEAVGLCFSDLKLLNQFSAHPRKTKILSGIEPAVLQQIPGYAPDNMPTVPGHEAAVRIEAVGRQVTQFEPGRRYLVETDYRWLPTAGSNGSFGYNFEGALQQYVLMDTRVITSPAGRSMLVPVPEHLSASAVALVEPWACVENGYANNETRQIKPNSTMLIAADVVATSGELEDLFKQYGRPGRILWISQYQTPAIPGITVESRPDPGLLNDADLDDIIYFGSNPDRAESLLPKLAPQGLLNIVLCGKNFGRDIITPIGRIHYSRIRITGTTGYKPADSMKHIPQTGEIRPGNKVNVVGAAGPMGTMHVIRAICQGIRDISVFAGDVDTGRLAALAKLAEPLAKANAVPYSQYNPAKDYVPESFDYIVVMTPAPQLTADSVRTAAKGAIINIFAGIPATVSAKIALDTYIEKQLYFVGTSGSTPDDMKTILAHVEAGRLDTNLSVSAVCGLDGAADGLKAMENRRITGKIIVYPACKGLPLTPLTKLAEQIPDVAACLNNGLWTIQAEQKLLEMYG